MTGEKIFRAFFLLCLFTLTKGNIVVDEECLNYTVYPVQYELNIYPYVQENRSFYDCELTITVIANAPNVLVITLDAKDLKPERGYIRVFDGPRDIINTARPFEFDKINGKLYIYLREPLKVYSTHNRQIYFIKIQFRKLLDEESKGVFLVKYNDARSLNYQ